MKVTLIIRSELVASHSLDGYEQPHPHRWKLEIRVSGAPVRGRIIDLPVLEDALKSDLKKLDGCYLNESPLVDEATRAFPTCETLGAHLAEHWDRIVLSVLRKDNPTLKLVSVQVTLCEMDGREFGAALIEPGEN